jgi:hypothetical protein
MIDPSGRNLQSRNLQSPNLQSMAEDVARAMGQFHPGRPAFSALSRACDALKAAAQEVEHARRTYAPVKDAGPRR